MTRCFARLVRNHGRVSPRDLCGAAKLHGRYVAHPSMSLSLNVTAATAELRSNSILEIERATALQWGARAVAAFQLAAQSDDPSINRRWLLDGESYRQEAIEHAAQTEDFSFLKHLAKPLAEARREAIAIVETH